MKHSVVKSVLGVLVLIVWCIIGALTMAVCKLFKLDYVRQFPLVFHGFVCRLTGMQCVTSGELVEDTPVVYVCNHSSYLDVFVLGGLLEGSFVAKSEVAGWPVFGKLAKLQNTVFLERKRGKAALQIEVLKNHLATEGSLILFPEGTSTVGTDVAPFRSSLFVAAQDCVIQPVSVAYTRVEGVAMSDAAREFYAWYLPNPSTPAPNSPFAMHFFKALGLPKSQVEVTFHPPVTMQGGDRKACAKLCEEQVRQGLHQSLHHANTAKIDELSTVT